MTKSNIDFELFRKDLIINPGINNPCIVGTIIDWRLGMRIKEGKNPIDDIHQISLEVIKENNPIWISFAIQASSLLYSLEIAPKKIHQITVSGENNRYIISIKCLEISDVLIFNRE